MDYLWEIGVNRVFTAVAQPLVNGGSPGSHRGVTGGHRGSPGVPDERSSVDVPMCSYGQGLIRAASGTTLGVQGTSKMKENERFYGFTEFRGKPAGRGREGRGSLNQYIAG